MRAAGLLDLDLPADFIAQGPLNPEAEEDPIETDDAPEFHQDFLGEER